METIIALIVLMPLLWSAWHAWRTTMRDYVRDRLFELRDEWRASWLAAGLDMRTPAYADVRDYINAALRYTSRFRMVELMYYAVKLPRLPAGTLDLRMARTGRRDLDGLALSMCHRTVRLIQLYMLVTSLLLVPACALALFRIVMSNARRPLVAVRKAAGSTADWFVRRTAIEAALKVA